MTTSGTSSSGGEPEATDSSSSSGETPGCGDGNIDDGELCDDGDLNGGYGQCALDCQAYGPSCGDGVTEKGFEVCDDGKEAGAYGGCALDCQGLASHCGDGVVDKDFEVCDDGDDVEGNGCNTNCIVSGTVLWEVTWTSPGQYSADSAQDVLLLDDGTIRLAHKTALSDAVDEILLSEFDADGNATSDPFTISSDHDVQITRSGDYLLSPEGWSEGPATAHNAAHAHTWSYDKQPLAAISLLPTGGAVATNRGFDDATDNWTVLGPTGDVEYQGPEQAVIFSAPTPFDDGTFIITGYPSGVSTPSATKFTINGTPEWQTELGGQDGSDPFSIATATSAGGISAFASQTTGLNNQIVVSVLGEDGSHLWDGEYSHPGLDDRSRAEDVAIDASGNVIVVGTATTGPDGSETNEAIAVKFDATGTLLWSRSFSGSSSGGRQRLNAVDTLPDGSVLVAGTLTNAASSWDVWLARLAP
jgi:cysteine-rich repeat protein